MRTPLEVWGGAEYTVNRVGDQYFDQVERTGHAFRLDDLDRFADLGIQAIRYPVLWERVAPSGLARADWAWTDERLARIRELGMQPIIGLIHHGSGPRSTSLVDPAFPDRLADFAQAVAERYPWVSRYTPVNEPLTTARFSGLYGHWYPHGRDASTFVRCLLNQCRAVILAMERIRSVRPDAELIQTDDLGKTYSTRPLAYQALFDNERRWLTWDLLCGLMGPEHRLWNYLLHHGTDAGELEQFRAKPCPPDIIGINHYLSSERFLDHRVDRYRADAHGGNGRERYADVLAARACAAVPAGPQNLLMEAWQRYHIPIAVTEAHNGCTREEQLRWLWEIWEGARAVQRSGGDVRAVTVWSLLGSVDWDRLCTEDRGTYEPGVFDLRAPTPRPTALARMTRSLAATGQFDHPVLQTPGWWRRPDRLDAPAVRLQDGSMRGVRRPRLPAGPAQPLVIVGARGTLGKALAHACEARGLPYHLLTRQDMDIADPLSVQNGVTQLNPWAVINAAGYVRVDDAESESGRCYRENADGPAVLAEVCAKRGIPLVTFSSDLVFDGCKGAPYVESDSVRPLNVYGQTKATGEQRVLGIWPSALVVRTSAFFGPWDPYNFLTVLLQNLAAQQPFAAADDVLISPTYVPDLAQATLDLLIDGESGIWHLANRGVVSWAELGQHVAALAGYDPSLVEARSCHSFGRPAAQPPFSALESERGWVLPDLENALVRYLEARCDLSSPSDSPTYNAPPSQPTERLKQ